MTNKEEQGYRNPAYIYDEGRGGGGPDTRSSSSASSRSSMKMIGSKLKQQGRTKWLLLAALIFVVVILVVGITVAVYFARNSGQDSKSLQQVDTSQNPGDGGVQGSATDKYVTPTTSQYTTAQTRRPPRPTTTKPSTKQTTTTRQTTTQKPKTTTSKPTAGTTPSPTHSPTSKPTTRAPSPATPDITTTAKPTVTSNPVTDAPSGTTNIPSPPSGNLTVSMGSILYNPTDVTSLTLRCEGRHKGAWETMTIRKQFKDSYEPIAVAVMNKDNLVEVFKLLPNVSHFIDVTTDHVVLTLDLDPFYCGDLTNYTCALGNDQETVTAKADVSIFMPEPVVTLPHSIVEDAEVSLNCVAEVWGSDATIAWKFKPEFATKFLDFSVQPYNNVTRNNCSSVINSTLTFNISMYEDGADFRCMIISNWSNPDVLQPIYSDVKMKVVPKNYCEGKQLSTIHPHPHGPCTLVVFCVETGPLVFEIECEPNHCYDYVKTACVPKDTG